jgi:RNA polymerase sigma factor FliA
MSAAAAKVCFSREQMIRDHLPQVKTVARKFHRRCPQEVLLEDLVSAGVVGVIEAYNRFDARRNLRFGTFAEHRIRGAIADYLRGLDPFSRELRRFQRERDAAMTRVRRRHARDASDEEIARELGIELDRYRNLAGLAQTSTFSLDAPGSESGFRREIPDPVDDARESVLMRAVECAIRDLRGPERAVIVAIRNGDSQRAIAERLRVTEGRVSQIKSSALRFLRTRLGVRTSA